MYPQVYNRTTRRREYLHRIVAAESLNRPLVSGEVVYHINGDKQDCRPENLLVLQAGEHIWLEWLLRRWKRSQPFLMLDAVPENLESGIQEFMNSRQSSVPTVW